MRMRGFKCSDFFLLHSIIIHRYRLCIIHNIKYASYCYYNTRRVNRDDTDGQD